MAQNSTKQVRFDVDFGSEVEFTGSSKAAKGQGKAATSGRTRSAAAKPAKKSNKSTKTTTKTTKKLLTEKNALEVAAQDHDDDTYFSYYRNTCKYWVHEKHGVPQDASEKELDKAYFIFAYMWNNLNEEEKAALELEALDFIPGEGNPPTTNPRDGPTNCACHNRGSFCLASDDEDDDLFRVKTTKAQSKPKATPRRTALIASSGSGSEYEEPVQQKETYKPSPKSVTTPKAAASPRDEEPVSTKRSLKAVSKQPPMSAPAPVESTPVPPATIQQDQAPARKDPRLTKAFRGYIQFK